MTDAHPQGRLLVEETPRSGEWNMAFDAALLDGALARNEVILRIYRWSEPTLSLGHFQKTMPADLLEELRMLPRVRRLSSPPPPLPLLRALPRVRRLSGGGAILHHHEWTYSCVVPPGHPLSRRGTVLYEVVHAALIESLRQLGIEARMRGETSAETPFLCFLRGDARDVLVAGHKITGSAQRRRRGTVLQHGSVLLRASDLVPTIPGLLDLANVGEGSEDFGVEGFVDAVSRRLFTGRPNRAPHRDDLSATEEIVKTGATQAPRMDDEIS